MPGNRVNCQLLIFTFFKGNKRTKQKGIIIYDKDRRERMKKLQKKNVKAANQNSKEQREEEAKGTCSKGIVGPFCVLERQRQWGGEVKGQDGRDGTE